IHADENFSIGGTIDGAHTLTLENSGNTVTLNGAIGGNTRLAELIANTDLVIANDIATVNAQNYTGNVSFAGNAILSTLDNDISFANTIESDATPRNLTLDAGTGTVTLPAIAQAANFGSLQSTGSGAVILNGALGTDTFALANVDIAGATT